MKWHVLSVNLLGKGEKGKENTLGTCPLVGHHSSLHLELGGFACRVQCYCPLSFSFSSLSYTDQSFREEPGTGTGTDSPIRKKEAVQLAKQELQDIEITATVVH